MTEGNFNAGKERRRFLRLDLEPALEIRIKIISSGELLESAKERSVFIKNISVGGGLLIELVLDNKEEQSELLAGKKKIYFETDIRGAIRKIKILGKVAWLKDKFKDDLSYEAGISFENVDEATQEDILHAMIDLAFKQKKLSF